jgi:hypothetical protein
MKNITLSVNEQVLAAARRYAAERNSSVNALVREYLASSAQREDRAAQARERLKQLSRQSNARVGPEEVAPGRFA